MRTVTAVVLCGLVLSMAGCPGMAKSVAAAKAACNNFYQSRQSAADIDKTLGLYVPQFFVSNDKAQWKAALERFGEVKSWTFHSGFNYESKVGTNEAMPGKRVKFTLDVVFKDGTEALEDLTFYQPSGGSTEWLILEHSLKPKQTSTPSGTSGGGT